MEEKKNEFLEKVTEGYKKHKKTFWVAVTGTAVAAATVAVAVLGLKSGRYSDLSALDNGPEELASTVIE